MSDRSNQEGFSCPLPFSDHDLILMGHGGGGSLMKKLIEEVFAKSYGSPALDFQSDSAVVGIHSNRLAFTTDSYVVKPLFFPGGDIGSLAVYGTVNDLAMSGARPLYLSIAFILEEGLPIKKLWAIAQSIQRAAARAQIQVVTGDTKVVDRGKGDSVFINTSGIGVIEHSLEIGPLSIQKGDGILVSGDLGRHGIAIMAVREGLEFETQIESDSAPLFSLVRKLIAEGVQIHCLRDLTRGGLASALNEIAGTSNLSMLIHETLVPVREDVQGACEILGLDPLYVANEGRFVVFVDRKDVSRTLEIMKADPLGSGASWIGEVQGDRHGRVYAQSLLGVDRILALMMGEQLPRIC